MATIKDRMIEDKDFLAKCQELDTSLETEKIKADHKSPLFTRRQYAKFLRKTGTVYRAMNL